MGLAVSENRILTALDLKAPCRELVPSDKRELEIFIKALSRRDIYFRFRSAGGGNAYVEDAMKADPARRKTLIIESLGPDSRIIAVGDMEIISDSPKTAGIGRMVASDFRRRGMATRLMDALCEKAREMRVSHVTFSVLAENTAAIQLNRAKCDSGYFASFEIRRDGSEFIFDCVLR